MDNNANRKLGNMDRIKNILLPLLMVLMAIKGHAQDNTIGKVSISSPTAASLGKYGDIPVGYHTGIPQIGIPLYTVEAGPLKMPISLGYHASGLKAQEPASWVGAGWALDAGGVITRTVMGAADDRGLGNAYTQKGHYTDYGYNSYIFNSGPVTCSGSPSGCPTGRSGGRGEVPPIPPTLLSPQDTYIESGIFDGEPDLYFFNFNGHSGKFYFNDDRTPVIVPEQDLKITPIYPGNDWRGMTGFIVATTDGTQYYFGKNQENDGNVDAIEITYYTTTQANFTGQGAVSAWYLNKVVSHDNQFSIKLAYQNESYSYYALSMFPIPTGQNHSSLPYYPYEYDVSKNFVNGVRLSRITFPNGEVDFNAGALRQDLGLGAANTSIVDVPNSDGASGGRALDNITVQATQQGGLCKKYSFGYGYFYDNSPLTGNLFTISGFAATINPVSDQYRLRLDNVQESSCDNTAGLPPYRFSYDPGTVPRKLGFGIDHWGFYNGVKTNAGLIPTYDIIQSPGQTGTVTGPAATVPGANRDPSWPEMQGGVLDQITYPTGGSTKFAYEPNDIYGTKTTSGTVTLASMPLHMFGQGGDSIAQNFTVDPSSNSIGYTITSTCNFSATLVITNGSNQVSYSGGIGNWDGFTGSNVSISSTVNLPPGSYTATLALYSGVGGTPVTGGVLATINQWQSTTTTTTVMVGGLRIRSITDNDGMTQKNTVTNFGYNYNNQQNGLSSGQLFSRPVYIQALRNDAWAIVNGALCSSYGCFTCAGSNVSSYQSPSSIRPMATTQGNHIGYGEVYVSQTGNGYTKYQYYGSNGALTGAYSPAQPDVCVRTLNTLCDPSIPNSPAAPDPFDPMRGELAAEMHFDQGGRLLKSSSFTPTYQASQLTTPGIISRTYGFPGASVSTFTEYSLLSAKKTSERVVTQTYDPATGGYLTNTDETYYNSTFHYSPAQNISYSSKGEALRTDLAYAFDYRIQNFSLTDPIGSYLYNYNWDNSNLNSLVSAFSTPVTDPYYYWQRLAIYTNYRYLKAMDRKAFIAGRGDYASAYKAAHDAAKSNADAELKPILELQDGYRNPVIETTRWRDGNLLNAGFTRYDYMAAPTGIPYPQKTQMVNITAPSPNFTAAIVSGSTVKKDVRYLDESSYIFNNGNLVQMTAKDGVPTSYLWGYNNTLPIAKADGIGFATLSAAYGSAGGNLSQLAVQSQLAGALVSTYIHTALVGITSQTDPSGHATYYEYDALGRVKNIRDQDHKIIKTFDYQCQQTH